MKSALFGLLGIVLSTNVFAADLKVGDKMPEFEKANYEIANFGRWSNGSKKGAYTKYDKKDSLIGLWEDKFYIGDGEVDYMEVSIICEDGKIRKPFGVSDFKKGLVYLDKDMDGYIDEIAPNKGRRAEDDAPYCPIAH